MTGFYGRRCFHKIEKYEVCLNYFDLKQNKIMFYIDKRQYFTHGVGKFLDISVLNRRTENCPELPRLPLLETHDHFQ